MLDSQARAAERGYTDLQQDTERDQNRAQSGLITGSGRLNEDYARSTGRLNEDFQSSLGGLLRSGRRATEDYQQQSGDVRRGYQQMGDRQTQTAVNQGVTGGGALAAALAARTENEGRDQGRLRQGFDRQTEELAHSRQGLNTSLQRALQDAETGFRRGTEDIGTDYQYGTSDRATGLGRAGRELGFYGTDINAQRFFQAGQSGWAPPGRGEPGGQPSNEFGSGANARRVVTRGNTVYIYGPDGRLIDKRPRRG
jgi:hypothetical protein